MAAKPRFISSLAEQRKRNALALKAAREKKRITEVFHEVCISRLFLVKPRQISTLAELAWLDDLILFRQCITSTSNKYLSKGWSTTGSAKDFTAWYGMTPSRIARLDILIKALVSQREELVKVQESTIQASQRASQITKTLEGSDQDPELSARLHVALNSAKAVVDYVYFKKWQLANDISWYKIGITSDPNRRDVEQNAIPAPAQTICCIRVSSMERARLIESSVHNILVDYRIKGAGNRELFELST